MQLHCLNVWKDAPHVRGDRKFWLNFERTIGWWSLTICGFCFILLKSSKD